MKDDLKIIIINDFSYVTGGADYVAMSSAKALSNRGYNVTLFSAVRDNNDISENENLKIVCTNQYDILHDPSRIRSIIQGIWNKKAAIELDKILNTFDEKNTIIHLHSWTKVLSSSIVKKILYKKFKLVLTLHDYFTVCPNGGFYNYIKNDICWFQPLSLQCICSNCDSRSYLHKCWRIARQFVQVNMGCIPNGIENFIVVSEFSRNILSKYLPENSKIFHVNNPIEVKKQHPIKVGENENFVAVGRLNKEKGMDVFAKAAKELKCNSVFVGDGPCKNEILKYYNDAKITGWVSKQNVLNYLKQSRALIYPSQVYETQGLPVFEAAALGIPSIVSDTCAARDSIINGVTGLLFKRNDYRDLIEKIRILQDPIAADKMGNAAYQYFWEGRYTIEDHVDSLIKVYEEVINRSL